MLVFSECHLVVKTHFFVLHPAGLSERLAFVFPPMLLTVSAETVWTNIWSGPKNNQSVCWRRLPCCIQINNTQTELLLSEADGVRTSLPLRVRARSSKHFTV